MNNQLIVDSDSKGDRSLIEKLQKMQHELHIDGFHNDANCIDEAITIIRQHQAAPAGEIRHPPSVLYTPILRIWAEKGEKKRWLARYWDVEGWGNSPAEAMADFDRKWFEHLPGTQQKELAI